jgi:hypothetical protein
MALVVHVGFSCEGKQYRRGDAIFGAEADAVARNSNVARLCTYVDDHRLGIEIPEPPAPADPPAAPARKPRDANSPA